MTELTTIRVLSQGKILSQSETFVDSIQLNVKVSETKRGMNKVYSQKRKYKVIGT